MSSDISIAVRDLAKAYRLYDKPSDRLRQMMWRGRRQFYREFWAVSGLSFDVRKGETVGVIGRNGSGKSTLLQMICGTVTPTHGSVSVHGRVAPLLELGAGFNPEFSGRENVFLNAALLGLKAREIEERFDTIAAFADIGEFIDQPVKTYSSGMYARLAFSVAVHVDPEVLIVDEILAVGDAAFQRKCIERFYEIRDGGCTILFVSHDTYQVKSICQRAVYLDHGRQVAFGEAGEVIDRYVFDLERGHGASPADPVVIDDESSRKPELQADVAPEHLQDREGSLPAHTSSMVEAEEVAAVTANVSDEEVPAFRITDVSLLDAAGASTASVSSGDDVVLRFKFVAQRGDIPDRISFVFNLYRHDDLYLCGTTTLMDGMKPHRASRSGTVSVRFPRFPLLSGAYKWRVAVNDHGGFYVHAEARFVCPFDVRDRFQAVGLFNLEREWTFELE
jgi:lipopolysaccharide transport system ATP-binding protein